VVDSEWTVNGHRSGLVWGLSRSPWASRLGAGRPALQDHLLDLLHRVELGAPLDDEACALERLQRPQRAGAPAVRRDLGPGQHLVADPLVERVPRYFGDGDHLLVGRVGPGFRCPRAARRPWALP
jgi:hypothetical protein